MLTWLNELIEIIEHDTTLFNEHAIIEYIAPKAMALSKDPDFLNLLNDFISHWDSEHEHHISSDILESTHNIKVHPDVNTEFSHKNLESNL